MKLSRTATKEDSPTTIKNLVNPQAPIAQRIADEVIFRHFQDEGVEFFLNRTSLTPHQIFDAYLLENTIKDHVI